MKKAFSLVLCFCLFETSYAQTMCSTDGKLTSLDVKGGRISYKMSKALIKEDSAQRKAARDLLAKKTASAIQNLTKAKGFYIWLWDTEANYNNIVADLNDLSAVLNNDKIDTERFPVFNGIDIALKKTLLTENKDSAFHWDKTRLWKKDFFNSFILKYYQTQIGAANDVIKNYDVKTWIANGNFLFKKTQEANDILERAYQSKIRTGKYDQMFVREALEFTKGLNADPQFKRITTFVKDDWFKKFIWLREGQLSLNPLDFTTEGFIKNNPKYDADKEKIQLFNKYVDKVIKRYIDSDTTVHVDQFIKLLKLKGSGADMLSLADRQQAMSDNANNLNKLLTVDKLLNDITLPEKEDGDHLEGSTWYCTKSFSPNDKFTQSKDCKHYLSAPIRAGDNKKLLIVNIPQGYAVNLKSSSKAIPDSSDFQLGLNQVMSFASIIAGFALKIPALSLATGVLPNNIPTTTRKIAQSNQHDADFHSRNHWTEHNLYTHIKGLIPEPNEGILRQCFEGINELETYRGTPAQRKLINIVLERYDEKVAINTISSLRADSLHLAFFNSTITNSSLPPQELKEHKNDQAAYTSKIITTKSSDDPVNMEEKIIGIKKKDTVVTADFSYTIGKTYRFQLSAGLAYTFADFTQTIATQNGGKISITNSSQQYRLLVGLNVYPLGRGLFLQDNRFGGKFSERFSFFAGVGIPKPGENIYLGASYDWLPGLKTTLGIQFFRNDKYTVLNNTIIKDELRYEAAMPFLALQIDPTALLKSFNIFSSSGNKK
jgi:hypothetical protein